LRRKEPVRTVEARHTKTRGRARGQNAACMLAKYKERGGPTWNASGNNGRALRPGWDRKNGEYTGVRSEAAQKYEKIKQDSPESSYPPLMGRPETGKEEWDHGAHSVTVEVIKTRGGGRGTRISKLRNAEAGSRTVQGEEKSNGTRFGPAWGGIGIQLSGNTPDGYGSAAF